MRYVLIAMLAVLMGGAIAAQDKPEKKPAKEAAKKEEAKKKEDKAKKPTTAEVKKKLEQKVTVEYEEMTVPEMLKACAEAWKLKFTLPEKLENDSEFSLSLDDVKASVVLTIICEEAGLEWEVKDGKVVFKAAE